MNKRTQFRATKKWKPDSRRFKQHDGKKHYFNKAHAEEAAIRVAKITGDHISAYRCKFCGHWHVGHTPGWKIGRNGHTTLTE